MISLKQDERGISVKRAPMFDKYEHMPIPPQIALNHGFTLDCIFCERPISKGQPNMVVEFDVYCSEKCKVDLADVAARFNL